MGKTRNQRKYSYCSAYLPLLRIPAEYTGWDKGPRDLLPGDLWLQKFNLKIHPYPSPGKYRSKVGLFYCYKPRLPWPEPLLQFIQVCDNMLKN